MRNPGIGKALRILAICLAFIPLMTGAFADAVRQENAFDVGDLQQKLKDLGYYEGGVTFEYDLSTQYALKKCCEANGLPFSENEILREAYDAIMTRNDLKTARIGDYQRLYVGSEGEGVIELQLRLKELGYFDGQVFTPGRYDAVTQEAAKLFCEQNNVAVLENGVDENTQYVLFSNIAAAYAPPKAPGARDKLGGFFLGSVNAFGAGAPRWVFLLTTLLILGGFVFIALRILRADKPPKEKEDGPPKFVLDTDNGEKQGAVSLAIAFAGSKRTQRVFPDHPILIGRSGTEIQLDAQDKRVSRIHGKLEKKGDGLVYLDTSRYGTNVNEIFVHNNEYPIHDGDRLQISEHTIIVSFMK